MLSPKSSSSFQKMIPTSPHADTGHECSDGFLSHSTSSYLVQLKSSGNSSGLLWYLILTILPSSESLTFIFEISFLRSQLLAIPRWSSSRHSVAYPRHQIQWANIFQLKNSSILVHTHFSIFPLLSGFSLVVSIKIKRMNAASIIRWRKLLLQVSNSGGVKDMKPWKNHRKIK